MKPHRAQYWVWATCVGIAISGCEASEKSIEEPAPPAATTAASPPQSKLPAPPKSEKKPAQAAKSAVAQFTPPFPDRLELFEPPKRAQGTMRRDDQDGETVELKGFVNVDRPRVVLSIDGVISPIHEGGEKYGVQVISIHPPSVVLQRGRSRWTATLE